MTPFEKLASELKRLQTGYREESLYRPLSDFLEEYANNREFLHMVGIKATNNPASESVGDGVGFPDMEVKHNRRLIGYIEVKPPTQNLDNPSFSHQFSRYKESLENVVFTNFKKWVLYAWDKDGKSEKIAEATWNYENDLSAEDVKKLLTVFFEGGSYQAKTPHQLAIALARKTKLLSQQVEDALTAETPEKRLVDLKKTFEQTLIQDIGDHQFANIYAETIAYSLFLAKLEHYEKGSSEDFTLRTAVDYLPKNVPIFRELYQLTGGTVEPITLEIHNATEILIDQLIFADIEKIYKKLIEHKPGEDPVIQFYEPFLSEYDPKERAARGVYYTPKPVVDYIIRSVDYILKTKFNKPKGLGDETVQILDPATGTGTFLMSAIQTIYAEIEKKNKPLGQQAIQREFNDIVSKHILKHLFGFELLVAPYAVAHLKLTLELERLGFTFSLTQKDQDPDNDRLKIYLANTLDDPEKPPQSLFGFESITEESEKARIVKKNAPILVVVGNPPYSKSSSNQGAWIKSIMEEYKKTIRKSETQIQALSDDYAKFMRFAQWKIQQMGTGIVGFITNNGYLDGPLFRDMRSSLLGTFEDIWILNLHGDTRKNEIPPKGAQDKNVFNIQQGVAIVLMSVSDKKPASSNVHYYDLWGSKDQKYEFLSRNTSNNTAWIKILPESPDFTFMPVSLDMNKEWEKTTHLYDVFGTGTRNKDNHVRYGAGFVTQQDEFAIAFERKDLINRVRELLDKNITEGDLRAKYQLCTTNQWSFDRARRELLDTNIEEIIYLSSYRPFDDRFTVYNRNICTILRERIMQHLQKPNLALLTTRRVTRLPFNNIFVTNKIVEYKIASHDRNTIVFPLYIYSDSSGQENIFGQTNRVSNFSAKFIRDMATALKLTFTPEGQGDLKNTFGPEDIFYYAYAVFSSTGYRTRYGEQLRKDFPGLPSTTDRELFESLIQKGKDLVNLHLLGENPFDKSKTIFDDTSKWNVKIGGEKPENLEDWKLVDIRYDDKTHRVFVNPGQYFEGIEKETWEFIIGGYQVMGKWLNDRKKAGRVLSPDDTNHYMKIVVSLRETTRIMQEIDKAIPGWPIK